MVPQDFEEPPADWTIQHATYTETGVAVMLVGPVGQKPAVVLKLPHTPEAMASLLRQRAIQAALHADTRLADWRTLLPRPITQGMLHSQMYVVEQALHGHSAVAALADPATRARIQAATAAAAHGLHRRTGEMIGVDAVLLQRWIDEPLAHLRHTHQRMFPRRDAGAYDRLRDELYAALAGNHRVSWIHGDLWPGNILIDPETSALIGLVDWDKAAAHELPLHDTLHLLLFTRKLVHQHGPADILAALGPGVAWTPQERSILDTAGVGAAHGVSERVAVLLYWLRQTASTLTLLPAYADDRDYVALNIDGVLRQL